MVDVLRAFGARRVKLRSLEGSFEGSIVSNLLTDESVVVMFALGGDPGEPIVIPIDHIREVVER
jgi:hypothetical protein